MAGFFGIKHVEIKIVPTFAARSLEARDVLEKNHLRRVKAKKTDVVIVRGAAKHFVNGRIVDPPHNSPLFAQTLVSLSPDRQEMIEWHSKQYFEIVDIQPIEPRFTFRGVPYAGPSNPFYRPLPFKSSLSKGVYRTCSGTVIVPEAAHGRFKISIKIGADTFDPHIGT